MVVQVYFKYFIFWKIYLLFDLILITLLILRIINLIKRWRYANPLIFNWRKRFYWCLCDCRMFFGIWYLTCSNLSNTIANMHALVGIFILLVFKHFPAWLTLNFLHRKTLWFSLDYYFCCENHVVLIFLSLC